MPVPLLDLVEIRLDDYCRLISGGSVMGARGHDGAGQGREAIQEVPRARLSDALAQEGHVDLGGGAGLMSGYVAGSAVGLSLEGPGFLDVRGYGDGPG